MTHLPIPTFETERLILRAVTEADAPAYEKHFVDYAVINQLAAAVPWPYPQGGVLDWIQTHILPNQGKDLWAWGLVLKEPPTELIGCVELWRHGKPENRGFWLSRRYWGQGLMTEAVVPIMNYAFDVLGFESLVFANAVGNVRSRRIKEKTGARFVRTEPAQFVNPEYSEREVWELTKAEWIAHRGA
jgi:[ribosomal protein S5]-alanine N-acetyltransferase